MNGPRKLTTVKDPDFIIATQFAQAGARNIGKFHFGVLGGRRTFRTFDDVLSTTASGLNHLIVLATFGIVEFGRGFAMVMGEKAATEAKRFELNNGRERKGMELSESTTFVKQFWHNDAFSGAEMMGRD